MLRFPWFLITFFLSIAGSFSAHSLQMWEENGMHDEWNVDVRDRSWIDKWQAAGDDDGVLYAQTQTPIAARWSRTTHDEQITIWSLYL